VSAAHVAPPPIPPQAGEGDAPHRWRARTTPATFPRVPPRNRQQTMRKTPTQQRDGATIDVIHEAAAEILQREGEASFTTNRIAERAGVSIGTLYQYFPNKDAILLAIAEREIVAVMAQMRKALLKTDPRTPEATVRELLRILIRSVSGRQRVRRAILTTQLRDLTNLKDERAVQEELAALIFEVRRRRAAGPGDAAVGLRPLSEASLFVIFSAVGGALRAAVLEDSPLLGTPTFEDELVRLTMGMLRA